MRLRTFAWPLLLAVPLVFACQTSDAPSGEAAGTEIATARTTASGARDEIRVVGSSTVYPFTTKVAEKLGRSTAYRTPVIESTGTGGGFKLFCAGVGVEHPDVSNASRKIKTSEVATCAANGVDEITEVKIGYDGIVVANSVSGPRFELTRTQLFQALAKDVPTADGTLEPNPYTRWSEIGSSLPDKKIEVYGPPPTSGTRDAFVELVMEEGCQEHAWVADLADSDKDRFKGICHGIREDGAYIEAGENDNLIVQKLDANVDAMGIFGYSFLEENMDKVQGSLVDGAEPTFDNIVAQTYPISRPLFVYVKKAHVGLIPGIDAFVEELTSERAIGSEGYLTEIGLIPLADEERSQVREQASSFADNV
jgi:phosphate transport system substrate-binding protein